ncbi:hypothetical protein ON010_g14435 [Phytophthora cinnamomi]|nr:hypothetical protein ON010_g14435 [Phytophthora cinnamomi]
MPSRQSPLHSSSSSRTPQRQTCHSSPASAASRSSRRATASPRTTPRRRSARARTAQAEHLQSMLEMLEDREKARREELNQFDTEPECNETEVASACPILDEIYRDGGAAAVFRFCKFHPEN